MPPKNPNIKTKEMAMASSVDAPEFSMVHANECIVCADVLDGDSKLYTVSICGHPESICSLCFFRIRSLQHNFSCPTCKRQLDHVICVPDASVKYEDFNFWGDNIEGYHYDEPSKMYFPADYFQKYAAKLRQYQCRLCNQSRRDFKQLKGHYFGEHQKHLCQLCHENKQIFPAELVCYDQTTYERHIRQGDGDGSVGHPNCEFCRTRFYDSHALFIHLSREHYTCHICEQLGLKFKYYHSYQHLEVHFRKDHIVCEDPACLERRFVVFSNEFDFAAHTRQFHPHLATGRGVQIRFNYKTGGGTTTAVPTESLKTEDRQSSTDSPDYISRSARYEGGLGGRAQNGEWQVEIQSMSRDPRDPNRNIQRETVAPNAGAVQEEFPTLAASMGPPGGSLGSYKWSNARGDGINQMKKQENDFPSLPSSAQSKNAAFNKSSLVKSAMPISRSTGNLTSSTGSGKSAGSNKASYSNAPQASRSVAPAAVEQQEESSSSNGDYSYEFDMAAAISASLLLNAPPPRPTTSAKSNKSSAQTLEEAFPVLGAPSVAVPTEDQTKKKVVQQNKPKISSDLMAAMKMIGADPSKKKKKVGSGLTVVKTLKPKAEATTDESSCSPVPPRSTSSSAIPPAPPAVNVRLSTAASVAGGIGAGPSWGKSFGGFGGEATTGKSAKNSDFPTLK